LASINVPRFDEPIGYIRDGKVYATQKFHAFLDSLVEDTKTVDQNVEAVSVVQNEVTAIQITGSPPSQQAINELTDRINAYDGNGQIP